MMLQKGDLIAVTAIGEWLGARALTLKVSCDTIWPPIEENVFLQSMGDGKSTWAVKKCSVRWDEAYSIPLLNTKSKFLDLILVGKIRVVSASEIQNWNSVVDIEKLSAVFKPE